MTRILFLFVFCIVLPCAASAQLVITEVMYDLAEGSDSGREWIEVLNTSGAVVDLTAWKVFENGTNHKISGGSAVQPGTYAVIADNAEKFRADWPSFTGVVFDSAFSLSNDGEALSLRSGALVDVDSVSYSTDLGGKGTGDSLQLTGGIFAPGMPTPGAGIPSSGLVRSPEKTTKSATAKKTASNPVFEIVGDPEPASDFVFSPTPPQQPSVIWWASPILLAGLASGGIVVARMYKRDEWEIEEMTETR